MKDTGFSVPAAKLDRLATSYWTAGETGGLVVFDDAARRPVRQPACVRIGAGGLVSTVDDYLAFCRMMLNKGTHGRERILSRPSVELMTTDQHHAGAESGVALLRELLGQPRLGLWPVDHHAARRPAGGAGPVRLGRRLRHVRRIPIPRRTWSAS